MCMRGVALARLDVHDRQREILGRNNGRIAVLAGAAGANEAVLRALVAFDLGILEGSPIGLLLADAADIFLHDVFDRNADEFRRTRVTCNAHGVLLSIAISRIESRLGVRAPSTTLGMCTRHSAAARRRASSTSCQTCDGVNGRSRSSTPRVRSASATALATTPPAAMMPPSPAPLAPSGLIGEGYSSSITARMFGKSLAVGTR